MAPANHGNHTSATQEVFPLRQGASRDAGSGTWRHRYDGKDSRFHGDRHPERRRRRGLEYGLQAGQQQGPTSILLMFLHRPAPGFRDRPFFWNESPRKDCAQYTKPNKARFVPQNGRLPGCQSGLRTIGLTGTFKPPGRAAAKSRKLPQPGIEPASQPREVALI